MKLFTKIALILMLIGISIPVCAQEKTSDKPFSDITIATVQQFLGGLDWSTGYVMSLRDHNRQGIVLKASRLIYTVKISSGDVGLKGDLLAIKGQNANTDLLGLGFSASLRNYIPLDIGVSYLSGGYGWSVTATPISLKF